MVNEFYGFVHTPFTRDIPVDKLFLTQEQEEVLGRLQYAASHQWFVLLTGDCGSGKSTLLRKFTQELDPSVYRSFYIADSQLSPRHFYNGILRQLGVEGAFYRGDSKRILHRELELMIGMHKLRPVVIVDEAHLLSKEMLEELRFLLNFQLDSHSPLSLVLSGQSELMEKINRQAYRAISQRVNLFCRTKFYDEGQTYTYIRQQLAYAQSPAEIFSDDALNVIFHYSSGCPRLINRLCTHSLLYGAQRKKKILSATDTRLVIEQEM